MSTSLRSIRGGNFGFGVRPMRGALIQARNKNYIYRALMHPSIPNAGFLVPGDGSLLSVFGSDGNVAGTAFPATLIDGTAQKFNPFFVLFTPSDGYFWTIVYNAANEFRLIKANAAGAITPVGAKFSVTTPTNWSGNVFCTEAAGNIIVHAGSANTLYQHALSKLTGQIVSQNSVVTSSGGNFASYTTEDGSVSLSHIYFSDRDTVLLAGLSINGAIIPDFYLDKNNVSATSLFVGVNGIHLSPALSGNYIFLLSWPSDVSVVPPLPMIERTEFDRWLKDVVNKFKYV